MIVILLTINQNVQLLIIIIIIIISLEVIAGLFGAKWLSWVHSSIGQENHIGFVVVGYNHWLVPPIQPTITINTTTIQPNTITIVIISIKANSFSFCLVTLPIYKYH